MKNTAIRKVIPYAQQACKQRSLVLKHHPVMLNPTTPTTLNTIDTKNTLFAYAVKYANKIHQERVKYINKAYTMPEFLAVYSYLSFRQYVMI